MNQSFGWSSKRALVKVSIPGSVESIGDSAFCDCKALTIVTIGDGVISIGERAFDGCKGRMKVSIPDSVESIGDYAIPYGATILTAIGSFAWNWAMRKSYKVEEDDLAKHARLAAEAARKAEADKQAADRRATGRCQHCGGEQIFPAGHLYTPPHSLPQPRNH